MLVLLLTTNYGRGGAESQVAELASRLHAEVEVVSLLPVEGEAGPSGVRVSSLGMTPGKADPRALYSLARILKRFRPDVLHAHMFHANLMARVMRLAYPVPVVISTVHSMAETQLRDKAEVNARPKWRDRAYRLTDCLSDLTVFVSEAAAARHLEAGAVSIQRSRVIPNGVDVDVFRPDAARRERTREALGLRDEFVWLAAGRLIWKKDYPAMLRAMARQRSGVLLIAGAGPLDTELRAIAAALGARVRFLGARDDMPALMNAADGFVLSSVVEGLPVALLEAAASGLPVVTTAAGGAGEAVLKDRTGFVVAPGDEEALAAAMARVSELPASERERMGGAAREQAAGAFGIARVVEQWERTYAAQIARAGKRWLPVAGIESADAAPGLDVTNRYVLDFARRYAAEHPGARILDYGCGAGRMVAAGIAAGHDIAGADVYYGGSKTREEAAQAGLLGSAIQEIRYGRLPYEDASFDLVMNNQVMEHVEDLDAALAEIHRVLKPGGAALSIFPSSDVFREGHIGIPFSHWFRKGARARFYYAWALRALGFGTWKEQAPTARQWAVDKLEWIDLYTRYRSRGEIFAAYNRYFSNEQREDDYIRYRLLDGGRQALAGLLRYRLPAAVACAVFRKLAFLVIRSRKAER
jgi:glycosyltransferase involved in cell wall biosynthesis/ubiquinone/menaquinone biosynthesis C-methylase UbiE